MKLRLILLLLLVVPAVSFTQTESRIDFTIRNVGILVDGHFNTFDVNASFDQNQNLTDLSGTIQVKSIQTGIESRDEHLLEEDYFNVKKHKIISLKSLNIRNKNSDEYNIRAELTIKGKTKEITIPVKVKKLVNTLKVTSKFEINRTDFDVGGSSFLMSKTVSINVSHYQEF